MVRIAFYPSPLPKVAEILPILSKRYATVPLDDADVVVVLGGDGFMLRSLPLFLHSSQRLYGLNLGTLGFLMNPYNPDDDLLESIANSTSYALFPLESSLTIHDDEPPTLVHAFNDVTYARMEGSTAHLSVSVDGLLRMPCLVGDGILLATPSGSTGYNRSCYGPILPLDMPSLALTPICPYEPLHWRGAILPNTSSLVLQNLDPDLRPMRVMADARSFPSVRMVQAHLNTRVHVPLLFCNTLPLRERIIIEQF